MTLKDLGLELIDLPSNNYIIEDAEIYEQDGKILSLRLRNPYPEDTGEYCLKILIKEANT